MMYIGHLLTAEGSSRQIPAEQLTAEGVQADPPKVEAIANLTIKLTDVPGIR